PVAAAPGRGGQGRHDRRARRADRGHGCRHQHAVTARAVTAHPERTEENKEEKMMTKTAVQTDQAPQPAGPYSQGVEANGFFVTAGFGPPNPPPARAGADSVTGSSE